MPKNDKSEKAGNPGKEEDKPVTLTQQQLEELAGGYGAAGELNEAQQSLLRRFTPNELRAIINIVWLSDVMQSVRDRLDKLEGANDVREPVQAS